MESYEVEVGGKILPGEPQPHPCFFSFTRYLPVKPIANLSGHSINRYQIHGGKSVQLIKNNDQTKMEEGEYFAIETFGSTGRGYVIEAGECSHYAKIADAPHAPLRSVSLDIIVNIYSADHVSSPYRLTSAKSLLKTINKEFGTLPFCRRYLDRVGESKYLLAVCESLVLKSATADPPLCTAKQSGKPRYRAELSSPLRGKRCYDGAICEFLVYHKAWVWYDDVNRNTLSFYVQP